MPQKYHPLPSSELDTDSEKHLTTPSPKRQLANRLITLTAFVILLLVGTTTIYTLTTRPYRSPTCGTTSTAARAAGCIYEPMLRSWIPSQCYTPTPASEYSPFDDRAWFYDKNLTQPMLGSDLDVLRRGDDITAYTKFFHDEHCLYAWRKLHLAVEHRYGYVDSKTMSLHHSTHCSKRIARLIYNVGMWGMNETLEHTSTAPIMFQTCVPLPWARGWFGW